MPVVGGTDIEIITAADADFLYGEKRIMKFFGLEKKDVWHEQLIAQLVHVHEQDILLV